MGSDVSADSPGRLILLSGLPGSGKTSLAIELERSTPLVRFDPDEILLALGFDLFDEDARDRVERWCWTVTQRLLALSQTVILEYGFWRKSERDEKRDIAHSLGATAELYFLDADIEELIARVTSRAMRGQSQVVITAEQMRTWMTFFEPPDATEGAQFERFIVRDSRTSKA